MIYVAQKICIKVLKVINIIAIIYQNLVTFLWEITDRFFFFTFCIELGFPPGKESACNAGDLDSIPGSGRSLGEGNGNPLQYSCMENSTSRGAWQTTDHGVTKSWLSGYEFEQTPGDSEEQGSLACCGPWGRKESDMTWRLSNTNKCLEFNSFTS